MSARLVKACSIFRHAALLESDAVVSMCVQTNVFSLKNHFVHENIKKSGIVRTDCGPHEFDRLFFSSPPPPLLL